MVVFISVQAAALGHLLWFQQGFVLFPFGLSQQFSQKWIRHRLSGSPVDAQETSARRIGFRTLRRTEDSHDSQPNDSFFASS